MKSMVRGLLIFLFLWAVGFARADAGPAVLGEASVVVGLALVEEGGAKRPLERGARLREGITLETGANGFIYVNTLDGGFISLRPNSSLTIDAYTYNGNAPEDTHIKLRLNRGVVRAISGRGAQAARERFRMNTPVAAIGIRGTDFSVFTSEATTRVSVRSGGIVMSPFVDGCSPGGSGPCEGGAGRELSSQRLGAILQINHGDAQPTLLGPQFQHLAPDVMSPPGKDEGTGTGTGTGVQGRAAAPAVPAAAIANEIAFDDVVKDVKPRPPKPPVVEPPIVVTPPPPAPEPPESRKIFWGATRSLPSCQQIPAWKHCWTACARWLPLALMARLR
ncbi:FecR family protein [Cupriavidus basilensis]